MCGTGLTRNRRPTGYVFFFFFFNPPADVGKKYGFSSHTSAYQIHAYERKELSRNNDGGRRSERMDVVKCVLSSVAAIQANRA